MGHKPRKRFGQHFLTDQQMIQRIVAAISPKQDERLIEIGPGQGALTLPLLKQAKKMDAVELDRDLIASLQQAAAKYGDLSIHAADALAFDFSSLKQDDRLLRICGNLPYNISTPLIFHLLDYVDIVADMIFMLQKEVAERLAAKPGTADYGRLSVMVQYHCEVDLLFDVPPEAFYPPPKVESSIVKLKPYPQKPFVAVNHALFASIVKQAFSQRRKTLRNTLKEMISDDMWQQVNINSSLRAENLKVEDFVRMTNIMDSKI